jgi:hypothetical protein
MSVMRRRLANELIKINQKEEDDPDSMNYFLTGHTAQQFHFMLFISSNKIYYIKIMYGITYPFKQPQVFITDSEGTNLISYINLLQNIKVDRGASTCLCCKSLICGIKWGSCCNTINIMEEITTNLNIQRRNVEVNCLNSVLRQKISSSGKNLEHLIEYGHISSFL